MASGGTTSALVAISLIFVGNLLPFGGAIILDWTLPEALFVYWIEVGLFVFLYTALILFAQEEPRLDERMIGPATIRVPFVSSRSGAIQPVGWLPPLYYRNVKYSCGFFPVGFMFWVLSANLFLANSDPGFHYDTEGSTGVPLEQYLSVIESAYTPEALAVGVLLFGVRVFFVCHGFFRRRRYEGFSAPMVVEIPFRIGLFWFLLSAFSTVSLPFFVLPLLSEYGIATVTEAWIITIAVFGKFTMEWAAFQGGRPERSDGLVRWLTPEVLPDPNAS